MNVSPLDLLRARAEAESLTDTYGASLSRRLVWPSPTSVCIGAATAEEIAVLRELCGGGDAATIHGPLELFLVLTGPMALTVVEALADAV